MSHHRLFSSLSSIKVLYAPLLHHSQKVLDRHDGRGSVDGSVDLPLAAMVA